ncbi:MAG: GTP 3',8-cyclase MoaA [Coriobacteriales bacterium]|jgi:cyclic pyranopterin phosphate synthase
MATDALGRSIDYLRISVTDKCNFRCLYCMPEEGVPQLGHQDILHIEEIVRFVRVVAAEGISNIRITGGEPLVRKGIVSLVEQIHAIEGIKSIALTTNAALLAPMAQQLRDAGVDRINISLDTLDPVQFEQLARRKGFQNVLDGIDASLAVGFDPVKINSVVIRSLNQDFLGFAYMTMNRPLHVRFIEFMPVGHQAGWNDTGWNEDDVIPSAELRDIINAATTEAGLGKLEPVGEGEGPRGSGPASYYRLPGAQGTIGFISSLSNHFCERCNRMRLTADGFLRPCLFSDEEFDVRTALREGTDDDVLEAFHMALNNKPDAHHHRVGTERDMSKIGG